MSSQIQQDESVITAPTDATESPDPTDLAEKKLKGEGEEDAEQGEEDDEEYEDEEEEEEEEEEEVIPDPAPEIIPTLSVEPVDLRAWMMNLIISRLALPISVTDLNPEQHAAVYSFFSSKDVNVLFAWVKQGQLVLAHELPSSDVDLLTYFLRDEGAQITHGEQFESKVQYGSIKRDLITSLYHLMEGVFSPLLVRNPLWPESVRNEFSTGMNRLLSVLTDETNRDKGFTVLYVPNEDLTPSPAELSQNKELVQRLEATVIHWTRQIKGVLNSTNQEATRPNELPLDEIDFWRKRVEDLSGISQQLDKPGVDRIELVLSAAKSTYLVNFSALATQIKEGMAEAQSNVKFLSTLRDPCVALSKSEISKIVDHLPQILDLVRLIWSHSPFYNTRERITSLLQKISNAVIKRCSDFINIDDIFDGNTADVSKIILDSAAACETWKGIYEQKKEVAQFLNHPPAWTLVFSNIFAQVEAFIKRCGDLLEICEARVHFSRRDRGGRRPPPVFSGAKGQELARDLQRIESLFENHLLELKQDKAAILDVKSTRWHDFYGKFKIAIRDLEVMIQNAIATSFESVTTVDLGVEIMEYFRDFKTRDLVKRSIDKYTTKIYAIFANDIDQIKKVFNANRHKPPLIQGWPKYAGAATWARMLRFQIDHPKNILESAITYVTPGEQESKVMEQYQSLSNALEEYASKTYNQWALNTQSDLSKLLTVSLMRRGPGRATLEMNFDHSLLRLFQEISYWEKLLFEIPRGASEVYHTKDELRTLREHVMLVVRDYNQIIDMLSVEERNLFRERIKFLDKKVQPGLSKLTWSSKGISDYYVADCRAHASKIKSVVDAYLASNQQIAEICKAISGTMLVNVDYKRQYRNLEFHQLQKDHRTDMEFRLVRYHSEIISNMKKTFEVFRADGPEVLQHWRKYCLQNDVLVEDALRLNVKKSLIELSRAINGDGKSSPVALFKLDVVLDNLKVQFEPTYQNLEHATNQLAQDLSKSLSILPRISTVLLKTAELVDYSAIIGGDKECAKLIQAIFNGLRANHPNLMEFTRRWEGKYHEIWEINKTKFIERYANSNPPLSKFDADIARYAEVVNGVQRDDTITPINFVMLDASSLKFSIVEHCNEWQNRFTSLLYEMACSKLKQLHDSMVSTSERLSAVPTNLDEMCDSLEVLKTAQQSLRSIEEDFGPLQEHFQILEKYEVEVKEDIQDLLEALPTNWEDYKTGLVEKEKLLLQSKKQFKMGLLHATEELGRSVIHLRSDFLDRGPFSSDIDPKDALVTVAKFREEITLVQQRSAALKSGLKVFELAEAPYSEIVDTEKDLSYLEQLWTIARDWQELYGEWKESKFEDIQTDAMEQAAQNQNKKLTRIAREVKDKEWEFVQLYRKRIETFRKVLPLVVDLKNPALRPRHWKQLSADIERNLDPATDALTLGSMIDIGLDQFAEQVSAISGAASKELSIEQTLNGIESTWSQTNLEIVAYKDRGHYILRGTEEIYQILDDNQVTLSTMKASRFVKAFEQDVDRWERMLSMILEVIEMTLTVQRQWMYLENIFLGEDIRKQLPMESNKFDDVNEKWKAILTSFYKDPNAKRATHTDGLLSTLNSMNTVLEQIQKSLDMYLETKRQVFPRFYFVSNDDLLEILGQSRNPQAIQPHLLKCFDNIKALELQTSPIRRQTDAIGMHSADGEYVPFQTPVVLEGPVEDWLCKVEAEMRATLRVLMVQCIAQHKKQKKDKWIKDWAGQLVLTVSQLSWTNECVKALSNTKEKDGSRAGLKVIKKKQISLLNKLTEAVRAVKSKVQRKKLVALITVEVHSRDVLDKLMKVTGIDQNSFEWLMQLRFYWERDHGPDGDCVVRQTNTRFTYGYEYLGNSGRLVITPLTDRCYMTLTTALHLHRGGSPKGPAGTGKTETVKDLGKALGDYVIVVNCSEGLDYKSLGRMFSGLAQTGAWGCFDEFNRINIEVLSVVAQQILSVLSAQMILNPDNLETRFVFEGTEIRLLWSCGFFITMNPGYAGRTELPDNLKSMFRPISMMVPDSAMIAEIILFGQGFNNTRVLAKKVHTLYKLAVQQLSKQDHYDFGLRALVSLLLYAGRKREALPDTPQEEIIVLAMKDMNVAKMTATDLPLLMGIMSDLFPGVENQPVDYGVLRSAIEEELRANSLQVIDITITKTIQLYETKNSRHSVMIVGPTGSGKSVAWRTLQRALTRCCKQQAPGFQIVRDYPINPKALSLAELYGEFNITTNEWADGVLSSVMRTICAEEKPDQKWIVFDAPVDTLWIESMNSVMDDNKILTLINGERISMPEPVSLLFEVEDLSVASPATVSRCGMVFHDVKDLGWRPYVDSWLSKRPDQGSVETLRKLFEKYVDRLSEFIRTQCTELVPLPGLNRVVSLCNLLETLLTEANGVNPADSETYNKMIELWFLFCVIWSICAGVDEASRKKVDNYIREIEGQFPSKDTVYEYFVDPKARNWALWETQLRSEWRYAPGTPFYKIQVPTVDTVRYEFLAYNLISNNKPTLMVGPVGTGKTSLVDAVLSKLDPQRFSLLRINMSSKTSSNNVQEIIESRVEKRTKGVFVPLGGKQMVTFLDDLNMPAKDTFGSQPPLELLRLWMDYGFWYDRSKQVVKQIRDMRLVAAMGPAGGGRMVISKRTQARFNVINMTFPAESQIKRIFGSMIAQKLQDFDEGVKPIGDKITQATIDVYHHVSTRMLPTPAKIHYLFNLRDISKVFEGMLRSSKDLHDTNDALMRLWVHECFRVFSDRLVGDKDVAEFTKLIEEKLHERFDVSFSTLCHNREIPVFGDFMRDTTPLVYEDLNQPTKLKKFMEEKLEDYNNSPFVPMNLVLFNDAMQHITRIARVIRQGRGNMLLIGVGGSGRQSLTRLAAFILDFKVFQIEVTRNYRQVDFREDLKNLYKMAGVKNNKTVFLFTDTQIVLESFLEDINNLLTSGEVPNLFAAEELEEVRGELGPELLKQGLDDTIDTVYRTFIERVRSNLHVVLCMSPVGEPFRNRLRMYPGLVSCTTIDYFSAWPEDALLAVAEKYLDDVVFSVSDKDEDKRLRSAISKIFPVLHQSVVTTSQTMFEELKCRNYVTPTSYLELVTGYKALLAEKSQEIGEAADKLANGLFKIDDTREKVQKMSIELEEAKKQVAQFQKECDEYLVIIVQQKRDADDQQKAVSARSEKIAIEAAACQEMSIAAKADLDEALPALEAAVEALKSLNKNDITEIKSYTKPPPLVEVVLEAVMILRKSKPDWAEAKKQLGDANFIKQLIEFDKDNMQDKVLKKIAQYVAKPEFNPEAVGRVSAAARSLCLWVRAMDVYGRIYKVVEPKRLALEEAEATLAAKQASLADAKKKLQEVTERVEALQKAYEEKLRTKEELRQKAEVTALKLDRAGKLVTGLAGERSRWEVSLKAYRESLGYLVGDCIMAAGFLSYLGPFTSTYRNQLVGKIWLPKMNEEKVPCAPHFSMSTFLAKQTDVRFWNIQGLPSDDFSTENGIIVTRGRRWPLMIDPQGQAIKWIKNMEKDRKLKVVDIQQADYMRTLENSIQFGTPVVLQNVGEVLDPSLAPILNKAFIKQGGRLLLKLGDKEIEYNPEFKFYITTKMSNPHYTPEISAKTSIVNFAVVQEGLRAQLLGIVVRKERPDLEEQKDALVVNIAAGKKKLLDLEDRILFLLSSSKGSLLDDATLVDTLNTSKITATEVQEQLAVAEKTEVQIDTARQGYKPCANRATILFFVLNDIEKIDPMYQFALDAYISLFNISIEKSPKSPQLAGRIEAVNEYHTYAVYRYACRGLFEQHKLLFSFHMNAKIMEDANKLNMSEYNFFLRGGQVLDRAAQRPNPAPQWIIATAWDNLTEMERLLAKFTGLANSFEQLPREWQAWYASAKPETTPLPGEWESSCNELQKMLFVRALRPDRVSFVATSFICNNLSAQFVEPPPLDMNAVLADSTSKTPLIFVLSTGVDPTKMLIDLAERKNMSSKFHTLSLGQGQAPIAERLIANGRKHGDWVFLANCHLSLSWMPSLSKLVELLESEPPHPDFRLWLSSSPNPQFPISILQAGIKITTEPPKGIKANMKRLYASITEQTFEACHASHKYKKLMFCLSFFHSVLIERRKFQMLGWNIIYGFNDSDYEVSENLLRLYLDEYVDTPWEALKYLIAGVNYGGHVTDDWDRRLLMTYVADVFNEEALTTEAYRVSESATYYIPPDGGLQSYRDFIAALPNIDTSDVFGQHPNADISSQIRETRTLLDTLVSLQPAITAKGTTSREDKVMEMSVDMLNRLPDTIDYEATVKLLADDPSPLNVVLLQEIQRYNKLLQVIRMSLLDLQKGIQGLVVMSTDLEQTFNCIFMSQVPPLWSAAYPSQKALASWTRDLIERVAQFSAWALTGRQPLIFWMSAFTFPTGFLTAVLQTSARHNHVPIDALSWDFPVCTLDDVNITDQPTDGVYIRGLYLEGAGWDRKATCLVEAQPMELVAAMPTIHFKPVENKKGPRKGYYSCPCYYYPNRAGEGGASAWSFVIAVDLKSGANKPDHWVKRATALLMSLDS